MTETAEEASERKRRWLFGSDDEPPILDALAILDYLGLSERVWDSSARIQILSSEDDDAPPQAAEYLSHMIESADTDFPSTSQFRLRAGRYVSSLRPEGVKYLAGHGTFDSSFPVLIMSSDDSVALSLSYFEWRHGKL